MNSQQIYAAIEKNRLKKGLQRQEVAASADISREYYTKVIEGKAPGVAHSIIQRLCEAVGIKILYYIDIQDK